MAYQLTVLITCKDERTNIEGCLESVRRVADEILVADSGSTDGTLEYVRGRGDCRVIARDYVTAGDFRNWAIPQARYAWVLLVDADERLSPELASEIRRLLADDPKCDGYWMPRRNYLMGHAVRHTNWGRDRVLRLFRREGTSFAADADHVTARIAGGRIGGLQNVLEHFTIWSWDDWFRKMDRYSRIQAEAWYAAGRRPRAGQLLLRPLLRFLREYILFGGFLDGMTGIQVSWSGAYYCFMKQARLWELHAACSRAEAERRVAAGATWKAVRRRRATLVEAWARVTGFCRRALGLFL